MCIDIDQQVDFVSRLPLELIEELAKHLDGGDILTCSKVCQQWKQTMDQENIWRRLCVERGWFLNKEKDIACWRNLYWLNQNWYKGVFTFYKFSDEDISQNFMLPNFNTTFTDFTSLDSDGEFLILPRRDGINIWDVSSSDVKLHQRISNVLCKYCSQFDLKVNKKYIVYLTGNYIQVFKKDPSTKMYIRVKGLRFNENSVDDILLDSSSYEQIRTGIFDNEMEHKAEVNDNYLVVVQNDKTIFIWLLKPWEFIKSMVIFEAGVKIIDMKIVSNHLFLLQIKANEFRIRAYDMKCKLWTLDLRSDDTGVKLDDINPRLIVGKLLIASLCPCSTNRTVLKVWNFYGQILRTIFLPKETYIQCCVVNDIVIYRSSKNTITVWSSEKDKILKELEINGSFNFIEICPGDLLLVARRDAFEIWDWKKGKQLYIITEQTHLCYTRLLNSCFYSTLVMDMDKETSHVVPQIVVFYFGTNTLRL